MMKGQIKPRGWVRVKKKRTYNGRKGPGNKLFYQGAFMKTWVQKPQSPIKTWADMTEEERRAIRERLGG